MVAYADRDFMQGTESSLLDRAIQKAKDLVMGVFTAWMPIQAKVYFLQMVSAFEGLQGLRKILDDSIIAESPIRFEICFQDAQFSVSREIERRKFISQRPYVNHWLSN